MGTPLEIDGKSLEELATYDCAPAAVTFTPVTVSAVVVAPAELQALSVILRAVVPTLLDELRDVEQWIYGRRAPSRAIGRHGMYWSPKGR